MSGRVAGGLLCPSKARPACQPALAAAVVLVFLAIPGRVYAQDLPPAGLKAVIVQQADDGEVQGYLLDLGPDTITVLVDGMPASLPLNRVSRVQVRGDSLKNGALIGALIGGAWCALVCGQAIGYDDPMVISAIAANAALWAGVGAGIDAMKVGRTTIFQRPSPAVRRGGPRATLAYRVRF